MDLDAFKVDTDAAAFMQENRRVAKTLLTQLEDSLTLSLVEACEAAPQALCSPALTIPWQPWPRRF